jgi:protein SCO1/2
MKQKRVIWLAVLILILGAAYLVYRLNVTAILGNNPPYQGTELSSIAPDFRLADQNRAFVSLSDFRGRVVVLTFMDSRCKDVCPLTAAQLRETYQQLDPNVAGQVVFLGVNVNIEANETTDVLKSTHEWLLTEIPSWHFLTGDQHELGSVWKAYAIAVLPAPDSITHTSGVYLINSSGQERWYISVPSSTGENPQWTQPLSELLIIHIRELLKEK